MALDLETYDSTGLHDCTFVLFINNVVSVTFCICKGVPNSAPPFIRKPHGCPVSCLLKRTKLLILLEFQKEIKQQRERSLRAVASWMLLGR